MCGNCMVIVWAIIAVVEGREILNTLSGRICPNRRILQGGHLAHVSCLGIVRHRGSASYRLARTRHYED